ncbi:YhgE/Pip domain-containing protein [Paenibacillus sp. GCM10023252]|uniref:YhgE/Pip domain-containing protein n=1 Tax=Paenibacillus sp. GCM10023252 TaxID=3252649 RepID=UPI00360AE399
MKIIQNKLVLLLPLIVIAVIVIFSLTAVPTVHPTPKNLPIAIVNQDQGAEVPGQGKLNRGELLAAKVMESASSTAANGEPPIRWIKVSSEAEAQVGLNNQNYYAALIIPADFTAKQMSLLSVAPVSPQLRIYVNQGMNMSAATMASTMLTQLVDKLNDQVRTELLAAASKQGGTLTVEQASALASPIQKEVLLANPIGTHSANGNAPISMFQPLWMGSLVGAILFFLAARKQQWNGRKGRLAMRFMQIAIGAVAAVAAGLVFTWAADGLLGLHIPSFMDTAWMLALSYLTFFLMISAILAWIGYAGVPLFVLVLFFGGPLLGMAPELMSSFYRNWIYSWLPMRFMVEGLRELFYFGQSFHFGTASLTLVSIAGASAIVLLLSALKPMPDHVN